MGGGQYFPSRGTAVVSGTEGNALVVDSSTLALALATVGSLQQQ